MQAGLERFTNTYRCVGKAGSLGCKVGVTEYCQTGPLLLLLLHCCTKTSRPMRRSTQWGPLGSRPPSGKQEVKTESSESLAFWTFTNDAAKKALISKRDRRIGFPTEKASVFLKISATKMSKYCSYDVSSELKRKGGVDCCSVRN